MIEYINDIGIDYYRVCLSKMWLQLQAARQHEHVGAGAHVRRVRRGVPRRAAAAGARRAPRRAPARRQVLRRHILYYLYSIKNNRQLM